MQITRRAFFKSAGLAAVTCAPGCFTTPNPQPGVLVNDVHTQLNPTRVRCVTPARSLADLRQIIRRARKEDRAVSIAGGRHAAGGQQFGSHIELADTRWLRRVLNYDPQEGSIEVEAGIEWPELIGFLREFRKQKPGMPSWSFAQKQTGTDRLSIGGALAANAHGRGLTLPPFIANVESIQLLDGNGDLHRCNREENADWFKLAIGGYGLFGFVYSATLRLVPLRRVKRMVRVLEVPELPAAFEERIREGFLYGDFQFAIDSRADEFLSRGIFACYQPVSDEVPLTENGRKLSSKDWQALIHLAHTEPTRAFERYAGHYLATSGQVYDSETQYASDYFDDYHRELDTRLGAAAPASEVIGELNVPRPVLPQFLAEAREILRRPGAAPLIYGTIRLIEEDRESFLRWAKQSYACVIFNLHTPHTEEGKHQTAETFRALIDRALAHDGSFYLTYHRYARRDQILKCYPQFPEFLNLKRRFDPNGRFQSDWYRHYQKLLA